MKDDDEVKTVKKFLIWFVIVMFTIGIVTWLFKTSTNIVETGIVRYEEYTEIYQTCQKLNTDICNMQGMNETDKMFEQFSKAQRILSIKTQLNRWVEDYNAKSKMINRSLWKASELPYQLNLNQFNCN